MKKLTDKPVNNYIKIIYYYQKKLWLLNLLQVGQKLKGEYSNKILELLGIESIATGLGFYELIKTTSKETDKRFPYRDLKRVAIILKKHEKKSLLQGADELFKTICEKYIENDNFEDECAQELKEVWQAQKGRPQDVALNVLIFGLVHDLKMNTGKPKYGLVADFLAEQNILELAEDEVRKRFKRMNEIIFEQNLLMYGEIFNKNFDVFIIESMPDSEKSIYDDIPLRPLLRSICPELRPIRFSAPLKNRT